MIPSSINVPTLRFIEFSDEWSEFSFGQVAKFKNGLNYNEENKGKGLKIIGVSNFKNFFSIGYENLDQISGFDYIDEAYLLKENDIIFVRSNGNKALIGRALYITNIKSEKVTHSGFTIRARITSSIIMPVVVAYLFQREKTKQQILFESGGINISNLSQEILSKIIIYIPFLPEQQKIASFLTDIDAKLELLTKKKTLLEQYKKGVMQQLFSQQIRFKDDNGEEFPDWEEKAFGDVVERSKSKYNPEKDKVSYTCIELESIDQGSGKLLDTFDSLNQQSIKNKFLKGEILFGKLRPYLRKFYRATFDGVCSSEIWVLRGKILSNDFLYYFVQTDTFISATNVTSGSKMPRAEWDQIIKIPVAYPTIQEQNKIVVFLSNVDSKLDQTQKQIVNTKAYKKGLLQQLFV